MPNSPHLPRRREMSLRELLIDALGDQARKPRAFDFELDTDACKEMGDHAQALLNRGYNPTAVIFRPDGQWCMVYDPLGKTIYATDSKKKLGESYEVDELQVTYHAEKIPVNVKILREADHYEAESRWGKWLPRRAFYYEVLID